MRNVYIATDRIKIQNLITNGDFISGTTGWTTTGASASESGGICTFLASAQNGRIKCSSMSRIINHKYYIFSKFKGNSNLVGIHSMGAIISGSNHSGGGEYEIKRVVFSATSNASDWNVGVIDTRASGYANIDVDYVGVIDLTVLSLASYTADQIYAMFPRWFSVQYKPYPAEPNKYDLLR